MLCLTADSMPYDVEIRIGYGTFTKLRTEFLRRVDALMKLSLSELYSFGFKNRNYLSENEKFRKEFYDAWDRNISEIPLKTRFLREYNLEVDDFYVISEFAWHSDCDGELSVSDCKKLLKFLSLFQEIEWKKEEEGEDNLFWFIPKCMINEYSMFSDSDITSDGIKRLYDVISFACEHEVPLQFI